MGELNRLIASKLGMINNMPQVVEAVAHVTLAWMSNPRVGLAVTEEERQEVGKFLVSCGQVCSRVEVGEQVDDKIMAKGRLMWAAWARGAGVLGNRLMAGEDERDGNEKMRALMAAGMVHLWIERGVKERWISPVEDLPADFEQTWENVVVMLGAEARRLAAAWTGEDDDEPGPVLEPA